MQRIIKFKAFSKATSKMMDWEFIRSVGNLNKLIALNHIELLQFTGLTDGFGEDIYEGDIYREIDPIDDEEGIDNINYFVCVFMEQIASFVWITTDEYNISKHHDWPEDDELPYSLNSEDMSRIKIIGNVFENPKMLIDKGL